ncbi:deoxyribodipyrimidine photo-lyase [Cognatishimia sp. MH4019]|uniref:FAD-binding domain-containing protein n=1 Tax=Cognatishimia sp. MH4019 TaxID=2854030 RepID=UPI001CD7F3FC|nr:deoxyribodipyrimidine photo-lyase [Cognatishimia sp. MH4019]
MTTLVWFKRDLRTTDHAVLAEAAARGPVLPLYIVEPELWALPDASGRQWAFVAECLEALQQELAALGMPLVVRIGDAVEVLSELVPTQNIDLILSHEETGNAWTYARDLRVAEWARSAGVTWRETQSAGVVRRLKTRDGWAARREARMRQPQVEAPAVLAPLAIEAGTIPSAKDLKLSDQCPERQKGGRNEALSLLGSFLTSRGQTYRKAMSSPLDGEWACSRLSPHLAFGTLSSREAVQASAARKAEVKGTRAGWTGAMQSFQARLAWRDHFMQKLEDEPRIETHALHSAYETLRPREPDPVRLAAWEAGETGLPFVDACMRYLTATGWLNFRMRSMLMAVASYHLWLDWRATGAVLARRFTDYEPGIHWSQSQMQSGTTGMNTVRIYNPVKQGHDQDPTGVFTRRWVPELNAVPGEFLQEPWRWDEAGSILGRGYPEPVVDVKAAAKVAREKVWAVRRGDAFRTEAAEVVRKHASRKDGPRHFVNDREPKRTRRKPNSQLSLDL